MPTFVCSLSWTDQGIKFPEGIPLRRNLARTEVAAALGVTVKQTLYTSGDSDILMILEAADAEAVTKWALVVSSRGNVRTRTARAFTEQEFDTLLNAVLPYTGHT